MLPISYEFNLGKTKDSVIFVLPINPLITMHFKKIAVAIAFSPRVEAILAESKRLQQIFSSDMIFVHIGQKSMKEEQYLKQLLHRFHLDAPNNKVVWEQGDTVDTILAICEKEGVDLLVAGALEKESLLKYFLGSVARQLCRKAKCSVLMLREPSIHSRPVKRIVVEGSDHPKTANTIETAIYVAQCCQSDVIHVIQESDASKLALIRSTELTGTEQEERKERILSEEEQRIQEILECHDCGPIKMEIERVEGKPGFTISKYARETGSDLLMLNSPNTKLGLIDRVFPHDIEFALADLPCDLMIIHSKESEA